MRSKWCNGEARTETEMYLVETVCSPDHGDTWRLCIFYHFQSLSTTIFKFYAPNDLTSQMPKIWNSGLSSGGWNYSIRNVTLVIITCDHVRGRLCYKCVGYRSRHTRLFLLTWLVLYTLVNYVAVARTKQKRKKSRHAAPSCFSTASVPAARLWSQLR